jgi:hypothetical protein
MVITGRVSSSRLAVTAAAIPESFYTVQESGLRCSFIDLSSKLLSALARPEWNAAT